MAPAPGREKQRPLRVGELVRTEVMSLLLRGKIRDPRAQHVLVSGIKMSDDLRHARLYIRTLNAMSSQEQQQVVHAMNNAAGFIRREIGQTLKLRFTPELQFEWDDVVDSAARLESIFHELEQERQEQEHQEQEHQEQDHGDTHHEP